jgi:hypothetical protein
MSKAYLADKCFPVTDWCGFFGVSYAKFECQIFDVREKE